MVLDNCTEGKLGLHHSLLEYYRVKNIQIWPYDPQLNGLILSNVVTLS
jgi:hypothetical protein